MRIFGEVVEVTHTTDRAPKPNRHLVLIEVPSYFAAECFRNGMAVWVEGSDDEMASKYDGRPLPSGA